MSISTRLDEAMVFARIPSQAELGRRADVPQPTINRILKGAGKNGPETATLAKLAKACGVRFDWLASGALPMEAKSGEDHRATVEVLYEKPKRKQVTGELIEPERLSAMNAISEVEAEIIRLHRTTNGTGKTIILEAARSTVRQPLISVVDDETESGLPGTSKSNSN